PESCAAVGWAGARPSMSMGMSASPRDRQERVMSIRTFMGKAPLGPGAASAAAVDLELMALDRKSGAAQRLADQWRQIASADHQRVAARDADKLVMAGELPDQGMITVGPVHPCQPALLAQPEQEAVD